MENSNSREYLDKITAAVIDNLRQTGPAPSVQMQDVPRKPFGGMTDEEEAELDDLDEDENKDVRMTEHRWDKHVENGAEFEASDDDEMAAANGATRSNGNKRTFTDFKDTDPAEKRGSKSPKEKEDDGSKENAEVEVEVEVEAEAPDGNDDTIEDVGATEEQDKDVADEQEKPEEKEDESVKKQKVDADGDVGMADSSVAEEAPIKKEEGEPEPAPETEKAPEQPTEDKSGEEKSEKPAETETKESTDTKADEEPPAEKETEKPTEKADEAQVASEAEAGAEAMEVDEKDKPDNKAEDEDASK